MNTPNSELEEIIDGLKQPLKMIKLPAVKTLGCYTASHAIFTGGNVIGFVNHRIGGQLASRGCDPNG